MRPIKFKAKTSDGEWVEGLYSTSTDNGETTHYIGDFNLATPIDPNTLSQFTGLTDKNGKEVYEGDEVKYTVGVPYEEADDISATVVWSVEDARYMLVNDEEYINEEFDNDTCKNSEIIGNIHDK